MKSLAEILLKGHVLENYFILLLNNDGVTVEIFISIVFNQNIVVACPKLKRQNAS